MLRGIADKLALTTVERRALTFLSATFVLGMGIRLYQSTFASPPKFDYSAADSAFAALSSAPVPESPSAGTTDTGNTVDAPRLVNLNTDSLERLMSLPGVGKSTAQRIIIEREKNGPFRSGRDLRRIRGIGNKRIEQLIPLVTVK